MSAWFVLTSITVPTSRVAFLLSIYLTGFNLMFFVSHTSSLDSLLLCCEATTLYSTTIIMVTVLVSWKVMSLVIYKVHVFPAHLHLFMSSQSNWRTVDWRKLVTVSFHLLLCFGMDCPWMHSCFHVIFRVLRYRSIYTTETVHFP